MATKKAAAAKKPMNKTEILTALAEGTGVSKKDVANPSCRHASVLK
jgi:hypothetical protein